MKLFHYIGALFYHHDCVIVPGFGGFVANYGSARIHPVLHTFSPPSKQILFNVQLQTNDGLLASCIAVGEKISYDEALEVIRLETEQIKSLILSTQRVEIIKVGTLYQDLEGNIQFEPSKEINFLLTSFGLSEFISPAIQRFTFRNHTKKPLLQRTVKRNNRRMPVAIKRAVWLGLPIFVLIILSIFSMNKMGRIYTEYADMIPLFKNESNKSTTPVLIKTKAAMQVPDTFSGYIAIKTIAVQNKRNHLQKENQAFETNQNCNTISGVVSAGLQKGYYIVGNCFSVEENAQRYVKDLQEKGFEGAGYFLPDNKVLYRAYFHIYADKETAETALKKIRHDYSAHAWILEL